MNEWYEEALPWLLWALGFLIVYMLASFADDAKIDSKEEDKDA